MADNSDILLLLGEIKGELKGVNQRLDDESEGRKEQAEIIGNIDQRLRTVEQKSAIHGAIGGTASGIGVVIIAEGIKAYLKSKVG